MTAGYSGTPLSIKLGIREGSVLLAVGAPDGYRSWLDPLPGDARIGARLTMSTDIVHLFTTRQRDLRRLLTNYRSRIRPDAAVWVSWPKKSSKVETDITEDVIRAVALPIGFVDVKVCAVDDVWSGLKLVIRKGLR